MKAKSTVKSPIIYLACPYTDDSSEVMERRYSAANRAAANLIKEGFVVLSPVTMTHPIDKLLAGNDATLGSDFWVQFDEAFMSVCSELVVLRADGWQTSSGVLREIAFFEERGLPIRYIEPQANLADEQTNIGGEYRRNM